MFKSSGPLGPMRRLGYVGASERRSGHRPGEQKERGGRPDRAKGAQENDRPTRSLARTSKSSRREGARCVDRPSGRRGPASTVPLRDETLTEWCETLVILFLHPTCPV